MKTPANLLIGMLEEYNHPSIAIWRSIELKTIQEYLLNNKLQKPILDLGCGDGKIAKHVFEGDCIDMGIEIEIEPIIDARKLNLYQNFVNGDAQKLPFRENYFGTIFSNCVIEHIPNNNEVLAEASRVLKKGGIFILTVPSDKFVEHLFFYNLFKYIGLKKLGEMYGKKRNELLNHFHCYKPYVWEERLKRDGLQMIYTKYYISKRTMMLWDLIAAIVLFLDKLFIWRLFIKMCEIFPHINKFRIWFFFETLKNHYNMESESGGALLIVARKDVEV